jgi:hypothetical protein
LRRLNPRATRSKANTGELPEPGGNKVPYILQAMESILGPELKEPKQDALDRKARELRVTMDVENVSNSSDIEAPWMLSVRSLNWGSSGRAQGLVEGGTENSPSKAPFSATFS